MLTLLHIDTQLVLHIVLRLHACDSTEDAVHSGGVALASFLDNLFIPRLFNTMFTCTMNVILEFHLTVILSHTVLLPVHHTKPHTSCIGGFSRLPFAASFMSRW